MNIKEYFGRLNEKSQQIFAETLREYAQLGKVHHFASNLFEFSKYVKDQDEKNMLRVVCSQLEASSLSLSLGMYRPALGSLRLAFEVGLGSIYFSSNKIEHREWMQGRGDLKWSTLNDDDNGVFSIRFADAFFPELRENVRAYGSRAKHVYRGLSEYVHGNNDTWQKSGIVLAKNEGLIEKYFDSFDEISELLLFALCCRYLKCFSSQELAELQDVTEDFNHISAIRELVGGPKDIK